MVPWHFTGQCNSAVRSLILSLSGIFTEYGYEVIFLLCKLTVGRNFWVEFLHRNSLKTHSVINYWRRTRSKKRLPTGTRATPRTFFIGFCLFSEKTKRYFVCRSQAVWLCYVALHAQCLALSSASVSTSYRTHSLNITNLSASSTRFSQRIHSMSASIFNLPNW